MFKRLPLLRPGREIRLFPGLGPFLLARRGERNFNVRATYQGRERDRNEEELSHQQGILESMVLVARMASLVGYL